MCTQIEVGHLILGPNPSMDRDFLGWVLAEMDSCWSDTWAMACSSNPGSFRSSDNFHQSQKKVCLVLTVFYPWRLHKFECFEVCCEKLKICFGTLRPPGTLNKLFTFPLLEGSGVVSLRPISWLFKLKITSQLHLNCVQHLLEGRRSSEGVVCQGFTGHKASRLHLPLENGICNLWNVGIIDRTYDSCCAFLTPRVSSQRYRF